MIESSRLSKRYGPTLALDQLTLNVPAGTIFGLLGPNGSGKTTFLKLLMGFIFPDAGYLRCSGVPPHRMGYLPERPAMPPRSRVTEYLLLVGKLSGLRGSRLEQAVSQVLAQVGLAGMAGARVGTCSKGMLQRLALAAALLGDPPLVILDEPMEGLDPAWQKAMRDLIATLGNEGRTILLSSHRLADVVAICTHVAILHQGRVRRAGALADVLPLQQRVTIQVDSLPSGLRDRLLTMHSGIVVEGNAILLQEAALPLKPLVLRRLLNAGVDVQQVIQQRTSLEELYLEAVRA